MDTGALEPCLFRQHERGGTHEVGGVKQGRDWRAGECHCSGPIETPHAESLRENRRRKAGWPNVPLRAREDRKRWHQAIVFVSPTKPLHHGSAYPVDGGNAADNPHVVEHTCSGRRTKMTQTIDEKNKALVLQRRSNACSTTGLRSGRTLWSPPLYPAQRATLLQLVRAFRSHPEPSTTLSMAQGSS